MYIDSSVVISILFEESKRGFCLKKIKEAQFVMSASLLEAEVYSAFAREKVNLLDAKKVLKRISLVYVNRSLDAELEHVFKAGYCRGADALHLAAALMISPDSKDLSFFTFDEQQRSVAKKLGFKIV